MDDLMPILDLQKRARELGRIRIGQKGDRGQPQKLDRFRLTSASKPLLEKCAELYGGTVKAWTPTGGAAQWEVITDATRIPIMVPPQPVSQWLETWSAGGCTHRCDGVINALTGEPCDPDDRAHQEARPTTRLNVVLRDVEGIGVWRLESHGWNAAVELPNAAEFLAQVGGYVNGWVALEERVSKAIVNGQAQTRRYMVPIIEIDVTPAELMAGRGAIAAPAVEGPVARPQIEAAPGEDWPGRIAAAATVDDLRALWPQMRGDLGEVPEQLVKTFMARRAVLDPSGGEARQGVEAHAPAEDVPQNLDDAWSACLIVAGQFDPPWDLQETLDGYADWYARTHEGVIASADDASYTELVGFRDHLRGLVAVPA